MVPGGVTVCDAIGPYEFFGESLIFIGCFRLCSPDEFFGNNSLIFINFNSQLSMKRTRQVPERVGAVTPAG